MGYLSIPDPIQILFLSYKPTYSFFVYVSKPDLIHFHSNFQLHFQLPLSGIVFFQCCNQHSYHHLAYIFHCKVPIHSHITSLELINLFVSSLYISIYILVIHKSVMLSGLSTQFLLSSLPEIPINLRTIQPVIEVISRIKSSPPNATLAK